MSGPIPGVGTAMGPLGDLVIGLSALLVAGALLIAAVRRGASAERGEGPTDMGLD